MRPGLILKLDDTRLSLFDQQGTVKQLIVMLYAEALPLLRKYVIIILHETLRHELILKLRHKTGLIRLTRTAESTRDVLQVLRLSFQKLNPS